MSTSPLPAQVAQQLLERLSSDDAFRAAFAVDPGKALLALGADEETVRACRMPLATLGGKEEFAKAASRMRDLLGARAAFTVPFLFEDGLPGLESK
ncbi:MULTISPECIES: NHLP-related RiPP peptide [Stenotrophomonas]|jgi:putative modified peptide|uniref:NHLP-related RiPP peptide n=1 Tax=Stenotrophomonas TaxID=40323 RepID=UPI000B7311E8|nr:MULTISPECIES: NHLP-related RiPP peptide [Stenotrophomonas]QII27388.1 putative modified peptide [Stenotrophomonas maltophilia]SMR83902.1 putative modified peptide [Stenotrophomonas sp. yr243]SNT66453.1 putative modified peptide [Stenotrophomonas lactitubi]